MRGHRIVLAALFACVAAAQITPEARLAKWKRVDMPLPAGLSAREQQMVAKLAELDQANYRLALEHGLPFAVKLRRDLAAVAVRIAVVDARGGRTGSLSLNLPPKRD